MDTLTKDRRRRATCRAKKQRDLTRAHQDSSKGGAVETGCSGLHHIIGCFIR